MPWCGWEGGGQVEEPRLPLRPSGWLPVLLGGFWMVPAKPWRVPNGYR